MNSNSLDSKNTILLLSLLEYYKKNYNILNYIITNKNNLSLRILDWLVTNYAKKYNIGYQLKKNDTIINFNIYVDYKNQLRAYSKKYFDPFCRRDRILINLKTLEWSSIGNDVKNVKYDSNNYIITTVGQLNFFKWFIENNIYKYALENIEKIDKDMTDTLQRNNNNPNKLEKKRCELSVSASKNICKMKTVTVIDFT